MNLQTRKDIPGREIKVCKGVNMQRPRYVRNAAINLVTSMWGKRGEVVSVELAPWGEGSYSKSAPPLASYMLSPFPMCSLGVSMIFAVQPLIGLLLGTNEIIYRKTLCNHITLHK